MQRTMIQTGLACASMLLVFACSKSPSGPGNGNPGPGAAPVASFTVSMTTADVVDTLIFDASGSSDAETGLDSLVVRWDWTDDGTYDTAYDTVKTAQHQYLTGGTFTIRMQVKDPDDNTATTTRTVTVTRNVAGIQVTPPSVTVDNGFTQSFTASLVDGNGNTFTGGKSWSVSSATLGSINSSGLFTAGTTAGAMGFVIATSGAHKDSSTVTVAAHAISYSSDLASTFQGTCAQSGCHDGTNVNGLDLRTYSSLMAGDSANGPVVVPGNASGSPIIMALNGTLSGVSPMPASGSVTQAWKNQLFIWINQGASNNSPPPK